jgi:hypothetical protein
MRCKALFIRLSPSHSLGLLHIVLVEEWDGLLRDFSFDSCQNAGWRFCVGRVTKSMRSMGCTMHGSCRRTGNSREINSAPSREARR